MAAGEEFIVTVSGQPAAELRSVRCKRRFVPTDELVRALTPPGPMPPDILAGLRAVDALLAGMDDGDESYVEPCAVRRSTA